MRVRPNTAGFLGWREGAGEEVRRERAGAWERELHTGSSEMPSAFNRVRCFPQASRLKKQPSNKKKKEKRKKKQPSTSKGVSVKD